VVCADHPSNEFFRSFPNCLTYTSSVDFVTKVKEAMTRDPQPLTPEQRYDLSWEAATQRFMEHSELDKVLLNSSSNDGTNISSASERSTEDRRRMRKSASLPNMSDVVDSGLAFAHYVLTGNELFRLSTGPSPAPGTTMRSIARTSISHLRRCRTPYTAGKEEEKAHCLFVDYFTTYYSSK
jgi:digalactosyldiacylglycerol synthase